MKLLSLQDHSLAVQTENGVVETVSAPEGVPQTVLALLQGGYRWFTPDRYFA